MSPVSRAREPGRHSPPCRATSMECAATFAAGRSARRAPGWRRPGKLVTGVGRGSRWAARWRRPGAEGRDRARAAA
jgi:hypothetical protein